MEKLIFQYGENKIQHKGALTCGEHVLYFILYQSVFYSKNRCFDFKYVSKLVNFCKKIGLNPDEFVWKEIYVKLKLANPPDLMQVLSWYEYGN